MSPGLASPIITSPARVQERELCLRLVPPTRPDVAKHSGHRPSLSGRCLGHGWCIRPGMAKRGLGSNGATQHLRTAAGDVLDLPGWQKSGNCGERKHLSHALDRGVRSTMLDLGTPPVE